MKLSLKMFEHVWNDFVIHMVLCQKSSLQHLAKLCVLFHWTSITDLTLCGRYLKSNCGYNIKVQLLLSLVSLDKWALEIIDSLARVQGLM